MIGIIGGADGPTVIFLLTRMFPWLIAALALFVTLCVTGLVFLLRRKK